MATLRAALAELFPSLNSVANLNMSDVIGNKTDTTAGTSLIALIKAIDADIEILSDHVHGVSKCYPTLAAGVAVAGGAGAWGLGSAVQIVPINTITSIFDIHFVEVEVATANEIYELALFSDAACTIEVGRIRTSKLSNQAAATSVPIMTSRLAANSGVWAKLATASGSDTLTISLFYHTY